MTYIFSDLAGLAQYLHTLAQQAQHRSQNTKTASGTAWAKGEAAAYEYAARVVDSTTISPGDEE